MQTDKTIRTRLVTDQTTYVRDLKAQILALEARCRQPQQYNQRLTCHTEKERLRLLAHRIESGEVYREYIGRIDPILAIYRSLPQSTRIEGFDDDTPEYDPVANRRLIIIEQFFAIAKDYVDVNMSRSSIKQKHLCVNCSYDLTNVYVSEGGIQRCPNLTCQTDYHDYCSVRPEHVDQPATGSESDDSWENLKKAIQRRQGLQQDKTPDELYIALDKYFIEQQMLVGWQVKLIPLDNNGRRGDTTEARLKKALREIKYGAFVEDIYLVAHRYWGWLLPNYENFMDRIESNYQKTQAALHRIPADQKDRSSSLGVPYRMWREFQLVGIPCRAEDFDIPDSLASRITHEDLWIKMCAGANAYDPSIRYIKDEDSDDSAFK